MPEPEVCSGQRLGEKQVPDAAYCGVQTARAIENFQISSETIARYPEMIEGLALVKMAAARANYDVGAMPHGVRDAIDEAGRAILSGRYHDQFVLVYTRAAPEHRRT